MKILSWQTGSIVIIPAKLGLALGDWDCCEHFLNVTTRQVVVAE